MLEPSAAMNTRTPWHLWAVGIFAVLFNGFGAYDYVMSMTEGATHMANMGMTPGQIAYYEAMPGWMTGVWAIGVWSALLASVLLLLRNRLALPVFVLSLAAFLLSLLYTYGLSDGGQVMGQTVAITSGVIALLLLLFVAYTQAQAARGVLR